MRRRALMASVVALATIAAGAALEADGAPRKLGGGGTMSAHDFDFVSIDGEPLPMRHFRGKAVLVVNTASFCGFTPQYADLEAVWRKYKARGLVVFGVPSNDFGEQEPGGEKEIKQFCEQYEVSFPLSRKEKVIGAEAHPFYRWIAAELGEAGAPRWNFHKYLVDRDGGLVGAWPSAVKPTSREISGAIEETLGP
jgi:glutathione peroxidase